MRRPPPAWSPTSRRRSMRRASAAPKPGRQPLHRLNRAEYGNAIRDLLGVHGGRRALLPADSSSHGFDNMSDVLKTSPLLLERYLTVGMRVAALAMGDTTVEPRVDAVRAAARSVAKPLDRRAAARHARRPRRRPLLPARRAVRVPARALGSGCEHRARARRVHDAVRVRDAARRRTRASRDASAESRTTRCRIATRAARRPRARSA